MLKCVCFSHAEICETITNDYLCTRINGRGTRNDITMN